MRLQIGLLAGAAMLLAAGTAHASAYITGYLWENNANANNATIANIPTTPADVTFSADAVQFSSFGNTSNTGNGSLDYTVGSWLNSLGAASNIVYNGTAAGTDSFDNSFIELTGTASFTTGQSFTVAHDDGLQFQVNSPTPDLVINASGPTAPATTAGTYTGPTGNFSFTIAYGECCGSPAVLETNLVPVENTPEPASFAVLATGLLGLAMIQWRRRSQG